MWGTSPEKRNRKKVASSPQDSALAQVSKKTTATAAAEEAGPRDVAPATTVAPRKTTTVESAAVETSLNQPERAPRKDAGVDSSGNEQRTEGHKESFVGDDTVVVSSGHGVRTAGRNESFVGDEASVVHPRHFLAPCEVPVRAWLLVPLFVLLLGSLLASRRSTGMLWWPFGGAATVTATATALVSRSSVSKVWRTVAAVEQWGAWSDATVKWTPQANATLAKEVGANNAKAEDTKHAQDANAEASLVAAGRAFSMGSVLWSGAPHAPRSPPLQVGDTLQLTWRGDRHETRSGGMAVQHQENSTVSQLVPEERLCWTTPFGSLSYVPSSVLRAVAAKLLRTETCLAVRAAGSNEGLSAKGTSAKGVTDEIRAKQAQNLQGLLKGIISGPDEEIEVVLSKSCVGALGPLMRLASASRAAPAKVAAQAPLEDFVQALRKRTGK